MKKTKKKIVINTSENKDIILEFKKVTRKGRLKKGRKVAVPTYATSLNVKPIKKKAVKKKRS